jgi:hypothetical protein
MQTYLSGLVITIDSVAKRRITIIALCVLFMAVMAGVTVWVVAVLSSSAHSFSDRLAEATAIIAGRTLLLALIAAIVAVMAYAAATGLPDLKLQVSFPFSTVNCPRFEAIKDEHGSINSRPFKQTTGTVLLRNESAYSAKNPAVIVPLESMYAAGDFDQLRNAGWVITGFSNTNGVTAVQWDGGPNYSVHGKSVRQLPPLQIQRLIHRDKDGAPGFDPPGFWVELLADGYRRVIFVPVDFVVEKVSLYMTLPRHKIPEWL